MILLLGMREAGGWTRWAVPPLGPQNPDFGYEVSEPAAKPVLHVTALLLCLSSL